MSFENYLYFRPVTDEAKAIVATFIAEWNAADARRSALTEARVGANLGKRRLMSGGHWFGVETVTDAIPEGFRRAPKKRIRVDGGFWIIPDPGTKIGQEVDNAYRSAAQFGPDLLARRFGLRTDVFIFDGVGARGGHAVVPMGLGLVAIDGSAGILKAHPKAHTSVPGCERIPASVALAEVERVSAGGDRG